LTGYEVGEVLSVDRNRIPVAVEGIPFIIVPGVISLLFYMAGWRIPMALFAALTLFSLWFFRNPHREIPTGENIVVSPADGKIIDISEGLERRILNRRMKKVSIFMNLFNVHINRIPCSGRIMDILYNPGKFISANLDKASLENEQNAVVLETSSGDRILFIQIAGLIARRIVCRLKKGELVETGQRFGLIRFGSRVDVYLPCDSIIQVSLGQKVKGGESVLALLNDGKVKS